MKTIKEHFDRIDSMISYFQSKGENALFQKWLLEIRVELQTKILTNDMDKLTKENILAIVATATGLSVAQIMGRKRFGKYVDARRIVVHHCWNIGMKLKDIALFMNRSDHSSIINLRDRYKDLILFNTEFKELADRVAGLIQAETERIRSKNEQNLQKVIEKAEATQIIPDLATEAI